MERQHAIGWSRATDRYHHTFTQSFEDEFLNEKLEVSTRAFGNDMPLFLVESADRAMLVTWINGDNWQESISELAMIGSGLTASPDIAGPNVNNLIVLAPFVDARQDKRTRKPMPDSSNIAITKKQFVFTEALAKILHNVAGAGSFVTVDYHSYDAASAITKEDMEMVNLTAVRLFADEITKRGLLTPDLETIVGTTDLGDLNRAVPLSRYLELPVAIVHKRSLMNSDGTDREVEQKLIYGDPKGKRVILPDDIISSGKTMLKAIELYDKLGAQEIILCATHPVFVGDYYENLKEVLRNPKVKCVLTTNSLPLEDRSSGSVSAPYIRKGINQKCVEVLDIRPWVANAARVILHSNSIEEAKEALGWDIWEMEDPYKLLQEVTGISLTPPEPTNIYHGEGKYTPLEI